MSGKELRLEVTLPVPLLLYRRYFEVFPKGDLAEELRDAMEAAICLAEVLPPRTPAEERESAESSLRVARKMVEHCERRLAELGEPP